MIYLPLLKVAVNHIFFLTPTSGADAAAQEEKVIGLIRTEGQLQDRIHVWRFIVQGEDDHFRYYNSTT
jgi:hypothetical protein